MMPPKTLRVFLTYTWRVLLLFIILALITGCSKSSARTSPESSRQQKKGMFALKKLEEDVEKLVKEFEKDYFALKAPPAESTGVQGAHGAQNGGENQSKQGHQQSKEGQQGVSQQKRSSLQPDWAKYEKMVFLIHGEWNEFRELAMQQGAQIDIITAFNEKLNEVTKMLTKQDLYGGLLAANDLYYRTVAFESLFESSRAVSAKRTLYYLRDAAYRALSDQNEEASASMMKAQEEWKMGKPRLKDSLTGNKVEFSLKELKEAVEIKDPNLIKMKCQIAEKNIKEAEKKFH
ncbi:hypothetical protein SAMN05660826_01640 [Caldanaerovirga acetigignens]|uniref:DUF3829 domain-containing protein n=1 Tax=Caldanaerovirga acetigignens TaxID=447595 RepID=A0A1M7KP26_9FIRM|nr:hypothetical protein [Caldanaerovirga acetigignens]SHM67180.1 hypothetical protein SAMN05660826_01640 [Caldanaerovirga acetigignens]